MPGVDKIYCLKDQSRKKKVYLEYIDSIEDYGHYNTIIKLQGYMSAKYYCHGCHVGYSHSNRHMCKNNCSQCNSHNKCSKRAVTCSECNRVFIGQNCFDNHIANGMCSDRKLCIICYREYAGRKGHDCEVFICNKCKADYTDQQQYCYIHQKTIQEVKENDQQTKIFVAYDIESTQIKMTNNICTHFPNLRISNTVCDVFYNQITM